MGVDFLLQSEEYRCMLLERGRTRSDLRHPALTSCGLLDRVQNLAFINSPSALKMPFIGNVLVEGNAPMMTLDSFFTGENISSTSSVCPFQNRPMVSVGLEEKINSHRELPTLGIQSPET